MNDLSIYFKPCISEELAFEEEQMGQILQSNYGDFPEIEPDSIAIFSVPEFRGDANDIKIDSQSQFRKELLQL